MRYLRDKELPAYKNEARRLKCKAAHYFLIQGPYIEWVQSPLFEIFEKLSS